MPYKSLTTKQKNEKLTAEGRMIRQRGNVFKILPTPEQEDKLVRTFGCVRFVYNHFLNASNENYEKTGLRLSSGDYKKNTLVPMKRETDWLREPDKFALECAVEAVDDAFDRFFNGQNAHPKFKSKRDPKQTYTTKYTKGNIRLLPDSAQIQIPKIGKINVCLKKKNKRERFRKISGLKINRVTVTKKGANYYVSVLTEEIVDLPIMQDPERVTGVDLGLKTFAVCYDGRDTVTYNRENLTKKHEHRLCHEQRKLSRMEKGSNNYRKQKDRVNKLHQKIANQRKDFAHKLTRRLADENQAVVVENLNIRGMVRNHHLAKAISDAGWYQFKTFLKYKLEENGGQMVEADRFYPSTKKCSVCGEKNPMITLSDREWVCPVCGTHHDRDENAAVNLRAEGLRLLALQ